MLGTNFQFQTTWLVPASIRIAGRCGLSGVPPAIPWLYPAPSPSQVHLLKKICSPPISRRNPPKPSILSCRGNRPYFGGKEHTGQIWRRTFRGLPPYCCDRCDGCDSKSATGRIVILPSFPSLPSQWICRNRESRVRLAVTEIPAADSSPAYRTSFFDRTPGSIFSFVLCSNSSLNCVAVPSKWFSAFKNSMNSFKRGSACFWGVSVFSDIISQICFSRLNCNVYSWYSISRPVQ